MGTIWSQLIQPTSDPLISFNRDMSKWFLVSTKYKLICTLKGNPSLRIVLNIAKGTTDPRVEFCLPKYLLQVVSQILTQILIKHLQNLDQAPTSKKYQSNISISTNLNLKILTKPSFRISTKNELHNLNQGSAAK